jgi:hypothetical protein
MQRQGYGLPHFEKKIVEAIYVKQMSGCTCVCIVTVIGRQRLVGRIVLVAELGLER